MRGTLRYRSGAWRLTADAGKDSTGKRIRLEQTVRAPNTRAGRRDAEAALARLLIDAETKRDVDPVTLTVGDYLEQWIARRSPDWAPSTRSIQPGIARNHIIPAIGAKRIDRLRRRDVADLHRALIDKGLAPASVKGAHRVLHNALADAVALELIPANPATGVRPPKAPKPDVRPPTDDELDAILEALAGDPQMLTLVLLDATLGSRRGELAALRWTDIDLEAATVTVARAISVGSTAEGLVERQTKTGKIHPIAVDEVTVAELRAHRVRRLEACMACGVRMDERGFVFVPDTDPTGKTPLRPDRISRRFSAARDAAGIEGVTMHSVRHYVATTLLAAGADVRTVAERLGHSSPKMTLDTYGHFVPAADRQAAELLARRRRSG